MANGTELRFFFWNCSLNPPKVKKKPSTYDECRAVEIITDMLETGLADVLVICELQASYKDIYDKFDSNVYSFTLHNDAGITGAKFDFGIIYRKDKFKEFKSNPLFVPSKSSYLKVAYQFYFKESTHDSKIIIFASHWSSSKTPSKRVINKKVASTLLDEFGKEYDNHDIILLMGDYNLEPHDPLIYLDLSSTQDRKNVKDYPKEWIYNSFHKLTHPRLLSESNQDLHDFGTCYSKNDKENNWATFDQILHSAKSLENINWSIIEEETGRFFDKKILEDIMSSKSKINHFPVKTTLRYIP
ncbi:hypothetical protein [Pantoea ananatis]|uniref:endonuclease/exonuclease/phosphatase family protein n=1 Tax=Pantoea ananas TaxID=553 RepID=UPI001B304B01|nr:hypothetical protein [Pantoea ananatis]MDJ0031427.1 hypothetical protein [Pantoea ananatis]